ncbi:uncharacterized protein BDR25DRAFT_304915 [Lindgomyces ingoldianus]|uniref:Uncharacterized protein n=1 Tax=Lindgomyces ingoldianus TaxID=673940 RepID=A0ACB6QNJ3_9PLEO|nr:uncharacterized protein BDR25DRAFT_304915 [Lindgomyces ingoldianus]KAF2468476.1 hypothetical protein BDR25DRAFT_304915 [Lindgomyces ingoldianus]
MSPNSQLQPPLLDHLILFLPPSPTTSFPLIPPSLTTAFTLTPGGRHADNFSSNTLILLSDGCYIELICFLPPSASNLSTHWWGPDPNRRGWTDWCLTTLPPTTSDENYERIKSTHVQPVRGGRKRPDGQHVKWAVTFPHGDNGGQAIRGKVPFFCHDETPRELRVPMTGDSTTHSCKAVGVKELTVVVKGTQELFSLSAVYEGILGTAARGVRTKEEVENQVVFEIARVKEVEVLAEGPRVVLRVPRNEDEEERVREKGFWFGDVVLAVKVEDGDDVGRKERVDGGRDDVGGLWIEYVGVGSSARL